MDNFPEGVSPDEFTLSYDDTTSYVDLPPPPPPTQPSLANRIGNTKVYLRSDVVKSATEAGLLVHGSGKRKREGEDETDKVEGTEEDMDTEDHDSTYRSNALLFTGTPISHLPTSSIFAYISHHSSSSPPLALEWISDTTCICVFPSASSAQLAYRHLQKASTEEPDWEGEAKGIPVALWPKEERISKSLGLDVKESGKSEGLRGIIKMRWARIDDVKKKGARKESEFYRKHGERAGKDLYISPEERDSQGGRGKRRRVNKDTYEVEDIDEFLAEDSADPPSLADPSPPSKMYSDYISSDGRTLLERTSLMREQPVSLADRIMAPLPRRRGGRGRRDDVESTKGSLVTRLWDEGKVDSDGEQGRGSRERGSRREREGGRKGERPKKSQQELDDELDAFLKQKD
ncbi:hypothetical protein JAAARDRAFT_28679 [Jaapia argillacea MUCL 33604]|uniref:Chromatin target of PRMT1 protein C-terminal domain-containing protein n=1 Tax=Jaapia argillacea MUCL 33604 TaxID=933084 RepID=A0A067QQS8_9AGAM|nr:hypothetical protein JAAARDRAFT_28679 [Jaapia argillacea MUCL 33604]